MLPKDRGVSNEAVINLRVCIVAFDSSGCFSVGRTGNS
jgi:hypothetical protein